MTQERNNRLLPFLSGLAVSVLIAAFVGWGVPFVLHLFDWWQVSKLNTVILYGMLFIIAKIGVQYKGRRGKPNGKNEEPVDDAQVHHNEKGSPGILSVLWSLFAIYTLLWLTPALIVFWAYGTDYPPDIITLFVYPLSLITALVYFYAIGKKWPSVVAKIGYAAGALLGPVIVSQFLV